jgi:hypothetical protein
MLRTSDIKHPDLAKAIEEGQPVEMVGIEVTTNGTPDQRTAADCPQQTAPAEASQQGTPHPPQHAQPCETDSQSSCFGASWLTLLWRLLGLEHCSPFWLGSVIDVVTYEDAPAQPGLRSVKLSTAPTRPLGPTVPMGLSVGYLPASPWTESEMSTKGHSDV